MKLSENNERIKVDKVDEDLVRNIAKFARTQVSPHASFFGGIIAQEVLKYTGKFMPLRQWLHYENFEVLPEGDVNREICNSRYDDQIMIFGKVFQKKLMDQRKEDIGQTKSNVVSQTVQRINPHLKVKPLDLKITSDNYVALDTELWEPQEGIINAVDNASTRLFLGSQSVLYDVYLFDSSTSGTKCSTQIIVPYQTQTCAELDIPDESEAVFPKKKVFPMISSTWLELQKNSWMKFLLFHQLSFKDLKNFLVDISKR